MIEIIAPYLSAISSVLGLTAFLLIVCWAWSAKRQPANRESAALPFDLPDEFSEDKKRATLLMLIGVFLLLRSP